MKKPTQSPAWVRNLRQLMEERGMNPRSLSLHAGLNATAVRDMLEGRSRFPRYDTVKLLAAALDTTPAQLMGEPGARAATASQAANAPQTTSAMKPTNEANIADIDNNVELLTEIIARLQELTEELDQQLAPRDFAAMTATIYRRLQATTDKKGAATMGSQIHDLLDYERLRQKRGRGA